MSVLRTIEHTIEGLVERTFGRAFRSHLQPVELARKLAREMEQNKTVSVSQVYVPNEYTVYLSPADRQRFGSFEASLTAELAAYVAAYARAEGLSLLSEPYVLLETDDDLRLGEFGIACRTTDQPAPLLETLAVDAVAPPVPEPEEAGEPALAAVPEAPAEGPGPVLEEEAPSEPDVEPESEQVEEAEPAVGEPAGPGVPAAPKAEIASAPPAPPVPVPTPPAAAPPRPVAPRPPAAPVRAPANQALRGVSGTQILSAEEARAAGLTRESMTLVVGGRRHSVSKRVTTIGRSRDNDLVVNDPNVSRRHAEIRHVGLDYYLIDLESTNGVQVNGQKTRRHALSGGDTIVVGTTQIRVETG